MLRKRDHVAARHSEPVDQDNGQTVVRYGIDRDTGVYLDAADAVVSRRKPSKAYSEPLPRLPRRCGLDHGQGLASRRSDPP